MKFVYFSLLLPFATAFKMIKPDLNLSFKYAGSTKPVEYFDPLNFSKDKTNSQLAYLREAELKHARWGMVSALTIPSVETVTHKPAIYELSNFSQNQLTLLIGAVFLAEFSTMLRGWKNPFNGEGSYWELRDDYQPGDLGFNLVDKNDLSFDLYDKELNNGRLAMIASLGMIVQELVTNKPLFL